jgi:hypothetical protein
MSDLFDEEPEIGIDANEADVLEQAQVVPDDDGHDQ